MYAPIMTSALALYLRQGYVGRLGVAQAREQLSRGRAERIITLHQVDPTSQSTEEPIRQSARTDTTRGQIVSSLSVLHYSNQDSCSLAVISLRSLGDRELLIEVRLAGSEPVINLGSHEALSFESLFYALKRLAVQLGSGDGWETYIALLKREINTINNRYIDTLLMRASADTRTSIHEKHAEAQVYSDMFEQLIIARDSIQGAYRKITELEQDDSPLGSRLISARGECDSAISAYTSTALVRMYFQSVSDSRERATLSERNDEHNLRLAHMAAILIPPALWFGLMGANVFPDKVAGIQLASTCGLIITLIGAVVSSLIGLLVIKRSIAKKGE